MTLAEIRQKYIAYCEKNKHAQIPSGRLIPENDATTLFTGSGMQPLLPYLLGETHPEGTRVVDSQKCFRAEDIDEVGDNRHTTFFEMLGNWSFGDYFKEEQLRWIFFFLVDEVGLNPEQIYVTCFIGDKSNDIPQDTVSARLWQDLFDQRDIDAKIVEIGTEAQGSKKGMGTGRIFYYDATKNWWSRTGRPDNMPAGEPGGPDSEIFYDFGTEHNVSYGAECHPNCDCGRFMEIGNNVFMEYVKSNDGTFGKLPQKNVDFGGGLERITAAAMGTSDVFMIDVFQGMITYLEEISGKSYQDEKYQQAFRIVVDHLRGSIFMIGDDITPSNKEQGYILRRLLRRAMFYASQLGVDEEVFVELAPVVIDLYKDQYPRLAKRREQIILTIEGEEGKFMKTLARGLREFKKMIVNDGVLSGEDAFVLFTTYGFPLEMTLEMAGEHGLTINEKVYKREFEKHRTLSRQGAKGKFKGGLAEHTEKTTALHTCTHIMLAGLRKELGDHIHQAGSNITVERTRFDFTHPEKVDRATLDRIEDYVNEAITKNAIVTLTQMDKEDAQNAGVEGSFWEKYPDIVNVYTVKSENDVYSQELCGGPHVSAMADVKGIFKILKEKSSSAGVRRIKAVLEELK